MKQNTGENCRNRNGTGDDAHPNGTDQNLAELIRAAFKRDPRVYLQPIDVSVLDGIVTLTGTVRAHRRKLVAYQIASSFTGCRDVVNQLEVDPEAPLPDQEVTEYLLNTLKATADIQVEAVNVSVTDGVCSLSGAVPSQWDRLVAEEVARSVKGVREVKNYLEVDPLSEIDQETLAKEIKTALEHARGLEGTEIDVRISGATVVLLGHVSLLLQKETAETVVRRFGLQDIRNDIFVTA